jgi:Protein of unknown function (DUF4089)
MRDPALAVHLAVARRGALGGVAMGAVDDHMVATLTALLELRIPPQYAAGVAENLERLLLQAKLVMEFELPPDTEPAPVFRA